MPGRDGTGPIGRSARNRRCQGFCSGENDVCNNTGSPKGEGGQKRGFGKKITNQNISKTQKCILQELEDKLNAINQQLEKL